MGKSERRKVYCKDCKWYAAPYCCQHPNNLEAYDTWYGKERKYISRADLRNAENDCLDFALNTPKGICSGVPNKEKFNG